jgi:solute carrier family 9 (sodium/hydrogen exchanger), member 6/7
MLAFASYYCSDAFGQSGIISIIVTAVFMGQYTWYNLSPQAKHVTAVTFQTLGFGAEAVIFSFLGLGTF